MSHDTIIHRLVRPVVRAITPTGVTPNQLTTARLLTGLAAALGFAQGGALWPDLAAGVMLLSLLLDRADGELARQTGRTSAGGYRYDLICDCVATAAGFIGLGFGVQEAFGPSALLLGLIAAGSVTALFWQINVVKLTDGRGRADRRGRVVVDPDDALLAVPVLVWLGWAPWVVLLAATATPLAALGLAASAWRAARLRNAPSRQA